MAKVSAIEQLLRRLSAKERGRLTNILNEEPALEDILSKEGAQNIVDTGRSPLRRAIPDSEGDLYYFSNPSPIAMMGPERFRSLAAPDDPDNLWRRAEWIASEIKESGGLNYSPFLNIWKSPKKNLPSVTGHEGRGRSAALEMFGLRKIPVSMEISSPQSLSEKIEWLRRYNRLLPEDEYSDEVRPVVDISDVKLFAGGGYAKGGRTGAVKIAYGKIREFLQNFKKEWDYTPETHVSPEGVAWYRDIGGEWAQIKDPTDIPPDYNKLSLTSNIFGAAPKGYGMSKFDETQYLKPQHIEPARTLTEKMWPNVEYPLVDSWPASVRESLLNLDDVESLRKMHGPVEEFATPDEFEALQSYTGSGYYDINRFLRQGSVPYGFEDKDYSRVVNSLDSLLERTKLLSDMKLFRGVGGLEPKDFLGQVDEGFGSWSVNPRTAHAFGSTRNPASIMMLNAPAGVRGVPVVGFGPGEMEVVLPRGHAYDLLGEPRESGGVTYYPVRLRNEYSGGGEVKGLKKKRKNALSALSKAVALAAMTPGVTQVAPGKPKRAQLFAQGALSQIYGLDENGEPSFLGGSSWSHWPGIVDEVISLPTILPDRFVPEASKSAAERLERLNQMIHEDMELESPKGLVENMYNAAGVMAAQIPTGGAKAIEGAVARSGILPKIGRGIKTAAEWFTPTVETKPSSYIVGTATGGGLNSLVPPEDDSQGVNVVSKYGQGGSVSADIARMKGRYASGGKTNSAVHAINTAISAIEKGDRASAVSALEPHRGNSAVADVLKSLKDDTE